MALAGCGGDDETPIKKPPRHDAGNDVCVDDDGDGFGMYCEFGLDCDDEDPESTDECVRCKHAVKGCPCKDGTLPMSCDPPDVQVQGGILVCSEGTLYCRDGHWSDCENIVDYVLVPD